MSLNSINKFLTNNTLWIFFSIILMALYLSPLFYDVFYVPTFDNLDSNVVWYKILSESGMIFADNNAIIPNMMNGLPRASYGSEFDVILWLYYFFTPKTAYIINEIAIHIVAFFSMFIFLKRYVVKEKKYYGDVPIYIGALYFALIPYWSGAGLTIAIIPLVTYSLLNIKNDQSSKWDWILLIILPLYTSFIFFYMFYIIMTGVYMIYDAFKHYQLNKQLFLALVLMGTMFLLSEYRLVYTMFIDNNFISHRTEFDIYFSKDLSSSFKTSLDFFLQGHLSHVTGLQSYYILPIILIAIFLTLAKRRFNQKESLIIWSIIVLSFIINIWQTLFTQIYILPIIALFTIFITMYTKQNNIISFLLILQIILAFFAAFAEYKGFKCLADTFPIFNTLNILRISFIQPFVWGILIVLSLIVVIKKLQYSFIFIFILMQSQIYISFEKSFYQNKPTKEYASFSSYYAPSIFKKIEKSIAQPIDKVRVVNYGLEAAVSLYNGFYTVDGYSTNYPLEYKHKFRHVITRYLDKDTKNIYDTWGSKVQILSIPNTPDSYMKGLVLKILHFDIKALCNIDTDYLISTYDLNPQTNENLIFLNKYQDDISLWDIYLYKINCNSN